MSAHPYKELYSPPLWSASSSRPAMYSRRSCGCSYSSPSTTPPPASSRRHGAGKTGSTPRQSTVCLKCSLITSVQATRRRRAVWLSARLSSCDELPRPTDSRSRCPRLVLHLPAQERQAGRGMTFGKQTAEKARPQRVARRPALERAVLRICGSARAPVHYIVVGRLKPAAEGPGDNQVTKGVTKKQLYILYTPYPACTRLNQTHPLSVSCTENCFTACTAWTTSGCHTSHTQHTALSRGALGGAFPRPTAGPYQKPPAPAALPC